MADAYKVLGQSNPAATTSTDLYTVPAITSSLVSSLSICNTGGTSATFRISVAVAGAALNIKQYIYYDVSLPGNDTFIATLGISLGAADKIRIYASNANLVFQAFGAEVT